MGTKVKFNSKDRVGLVIATCLVMTGCQGWSGTNWQGPSLPLSSASRVPPPGTGTYQLPGSYYTNPAAGSNATTSNFSNAAPVVQASANVPIGQAGQRSSTISAEYRPVATDSAPQVSTAVYTDPNYASAQVVSAGAAMPATNLTSRTNLTSGTNWTSEGPSTSASFSDAPPSTNLKWQLPQ